MARFTQAFWFLFLLSGCIATSRAGALFSFVHQDNVAATQHHTPVRQLQSSSSPEQVCAIYEATETLSSCECESFGNDVKVLCEFVQCDNSNNSTCYTGTIEQIVTEDKTVGENRTFVSRMVATCTNFTSGDYSETCIRVFAIAAGDFSMLDFCAVLLYAADDNEPRVCESCSVDDPVCTHGSDGSPEISFNCSNIKPGLTQTCGSVVQGVAIPIFDDNVTEAGNVTDTSGSESLQENFTGLALVFN